MRIFRRLIAAVFAASLVLPAALAAPVSAAVATHLVFPSLPAAPGAGADTIITVNALDGTNAIDTGYTGTVTLSTGNLGDVVTLSPHTYVGGDAGTFDFHVTFHGLGARTLTATDGVVTDATGGLTVVVGAASAATSTITAFPTAMTADDSSAITVQLKDPDGNNLATGGATVTVAAAPGLTSAVTDNGDGTYTSTFTTTQLGTQIVSGTLNGGAITDTATVDVTVGAPDHFTFLTQPGGAAGGTAFATQPVVEVVDRGGNQVAGAGRDVTLGIFVNPSGGTLAGTTTVATAADGTATFTDLSINTAGTGYTLRASGPTVPFTIDSSPFNVAVGPAHHVRFTTQPGGGTEVTPWVVQPVVTVQDAGNNTVLGVRTVTVAIASNPAGGTLAGTAAVATSAGGVATFAGLSIDKAGAYTLTASASGLASATSSSFSVSHVNQAPVAVADSFVVKQDTVLTSPALTGVLINDTDLETPSSSLTAILDATTSHGVLVLNANGSFTYTPTGGYVGLDSFTYHASDGLLSSNVVTASISVYVNSAPVALNQSKNVITGSPATPLDVLTADTAANPDAGETLHITAVGTALHGTVTILAGGVGVTYRPKSTYLGTDHFTYTISDGQLTATGTVTVQVVKDKIRPTTTAPVQRILAQKIGTSTVVVHLTWTGADVGSGVAKYQLQQSKNNGSYQTVSLSSALARSSNRTLAVSSSYRFRVRAVDKRGNVGAWTYGPKFKVLRFQENSATYTGTWASRTSVNYSGGKERSTSETGASATFTTTGRTFSWVAVRGTTRGTAQVFVDGVLAQTLNLNLSSTKYRYIVFSRTLTSAAHSIRIVFTGAAPKLIDLDGFIVLR